MTGHEARRRVGEERDAVGSSPTCSVGTTVLGRERVLQQGRWMGGERAHTLPSRDELNSRCHNVSLRYIHMMYELGMG